MNFDTLIHGVEGRRAGGEQNPLLSGLETDSRRVTAGSLFAAIPGSRVDGHRFVPVAIEQGAAALLLQEGNQEAISHAEAKNVPFLAVADPSRTVGVLADRFFNKPFERLRSVAVTGTNGKTTTTWMLESIFAAEQVACAIIGTIFFRLGRWEIHGENTTPAALDLLSLLATFIDRGAKAVALEASSHGLELGRLDQGRFDAAVFTNLSQDHLDFHRDMEGYFDAKARLFIELLPLSRQVGKPGVAVINIEDAYGARLAKDLTRRFGADSPLVTLGLAGESDVFAEDLHLGDSGSRFTLRLASGRRVAVHLPLVGRHNVLNALGAAAAAEVCGVTPEAIAAGLSALAGVPGRLEAVTSQDPAAPHVLVDYAHTPDALTQVLRALRELSPEHLWVVFGCGGDRDPHKRPLMGKAVAEFADVAIVTSDNPRSEDPQSIADQIVKGIDESGLGPLQVLAPASSGYLVELDRERAIARALEAADSNTWVLIAGKGHETDQTFHDRKVPFDDREVARRYLQGGAP